MPGTPKYGERVDSLDDAEIDLRRAQIESIEKNTETQGTKNGLLVVIGIVIFTAAIPFEWFLWHLAFK
jgi:hypothetical protein